jgi:3-dehydroquinate dehydratase I
MKPPRICGVITQDHEKFIEQARSQVSLYEVRLDLVGSEWLKAVAMLDKPWIATNRIISEGGRWAGSENERINSLVRAVEAGAAAVDIELRTVDIEKVLKLFKNHVECIVSYHNMKETPSLAVLKNIVQEEISAGADVCKIATSANDINDNIKILSLNSHFPDTRMVNFCLGDAGQISRVINPISGGDFAYAALDFESKSAPGQLTVMQMTQLYGMLH